MRFLGFDFAGRFTMGFQHKAWPDLYQFSAIRSAGTEERQKTPNYRKIRAMLLVDNAIPGIRAIDNQALLNSIWESVDQKVGPLEGRNIVQKTDAAGHSSLDINKTWSTKTGILSEYGDGGYCAGYMIVTFEYEVDGGGPPEIDYVFATARNLAKASGHSTVLHTYNNSKDQFHTEQILALKLQAFVEKLQELSGTARWNNQLKKFDLSKLSIVANIRWDHSDKKVKSSCNACCGIMDEVEKSLNAITKSTVVTPAKFK